MHLGCVEDVRWRLDSQRNNTPPDAAAWLRGSTHPFEPGQQRKPTAANEQMLFSHTRQCDQLLEKIDVAVGI